jgi:hypothetical protein
MQQRICLQQTTVAPRARPAAARAPAPECRPRCRVAAARAAAADDATAAPPPPLLLLPRRALLLASALSPFAPAALAAAPPAERPAAAAVREYADLEARGKAGDAKALDALRAKYGVRRAADGRVSVRAPSNGQWHAVRLDMEVPGTLLLRDGATGTVYALETASLAQVDLSDDTVVLMLFADGAWEREMATIDVRDPEEEGKRLGGKASKAQGRPLTLSEREFREVVGLLKGGEDA